MRRHSTDIMLKQCLLSMMVFRNTVQLNRTKILNMDNKTANNYLCLTHKYITIYTLKPNLISDDVKNVIVFKPQQQPYHNVYVRKRLKY